MENEIGLIRDIVYTVNDYHWYNSTHRWTPEDQEEQIKEWEENAREICQNKIQQNNKRILREIEELHTELVAGYWDSVEWIQKDQVKSIIKGEEDV